MEALELYRNAIAAIAAQRMTLHRLLDGNTAQNALDNDLDGATNAVVTYSRQLLAVSAREGLEGAARMEATGTGLQVMDRARATLRNITELARAELEEHIRTANADLARTRQLAGLATATALAVLLFANAVALREARLGRASALSLRLSEQRFRALVDGVKDYALMMLDESGVVLSWNTGAQHLYGYQHDEIINRNFACFYPFEARAAGYPQRELRIAAQDGRYEEEGLRLRKDGTQFLVNVVVSAIRDEDGNLRGFAKVTRDITESRRRDKAIKEQAQILDLANDTIFVRDTADRITYWNKGAQRVYGWTREEVAGQVTHVLLRTRFPQPLEEIMAVVTATGHWEGELEHARRDGDLLTVASRWASQRDDSGTIVGIIEMNYDITERKRIAQELEEKNAELLQVSRAKDTFLANMSHELRTPLNGIIGFSEILADGLAGAVNEKQKEYLGDILGSGRHLLELINDLLDLAKVGAGKLEFYPEPFTLDEAIDEACHVVQPTADRKRIALLRNVSAQPESVCLDRQRFKQILFNLLSNAVKFTADGGTVEVSTARLDAERFSVSVRDTGIGIAPADMRRLFKEFEQLHTGAERLYQGTGLGLALTHKLVMMQDGTIRVASELGRGSTFTVELPMVRNELESSGIYTAQPEAALGGSAAVESKTHG